MPVYEYECESCGVFSALRKMSESSHPAFCQECGSESPRIMSAPRLAVMAKSQREAHERNEKSAHEPKVGRRSSCGCTGSHTCKSAADKKLPAAAKQEGAKPALQMQTKKTARPWMLSH
jgi:putative FmdB family regulatory protein